ncbi:hypothetical protein LLD17_09010 [Lactococcus cremoris]|uniref:hypothetical protein n=1 Tax=Lactococcus lactis subsp. cremoris TaxID=1359 RepID=UPI0009BE9BEA|nr:MULTISPECIES: hypothetical protein [Lactococcus]ARE18583.2 hypothetical protein LLJM4_1512 [Lactococcus cremoris]ARE26349.1 hypothetical protein LLJM2_1599 [Lactococcus cremoris]MCT0459032.1 hypothetical protein [Lactococcus cremoris]MCT4414541.1 hypothetical protein [Lactococcus cremoris]MCT4417732.1 hypothetical protein [Lactococcus cremoris]
MTTQELIETLQKFPPEATVKIIQNDISGDRFFDVNTVENLARVRVTTAGIETVETVIIGI